MNTDLNLKAIRTCDHLIDVVIGLIASWTLAFHFSKLFNLERDATLITGAIVFMAVVYFLFNNLEKHKTANDPPSFTSTQNKSHTVIFLALIGVSALLAWVDLDGLLWPLAWILLIGVLFFSFKNSWESDRTTTSQRTRELSRLGTVLVIALALLLSHIHISEPTRLGMIS